MTNRVLLLGRTPFDPNAIEAEITSSGVEFAYGTSLADVEATLSDRPVDLVIMGAGIPLQDRLAIVDYICKTSDSTSIHMKDRASGRDGMMRFIKQVLAGLEV